MSKLFARAKAKRANVINSYQQMSLDDAYIDECCYNLQQGIEFCLKYVVEMLGESYVETHDIRAQLNMLKKLNVEIPCEKELRMLASTLNSWEAETRYNDNFVALIEDIDDAIVILDKLISYSEGLVTIKGN